MGTRKALIVDDSKSACVVLSRMLSRFSIESEFAYSAHDAFVILAQQTPDVIFMDHSMPDMDGLQAVEFIKNKPEWQSIPIFMFTAKTGKDYHELAESVGAVDVIPKALDSRHLAQALARVKLTEKPKLVEVSDEPTLEQKMQVWLESVIENKVAPALSFRIDSAAKELREETLQNSDKLYRESLRFHMKQQKSLVEQIQAEREFLSVAYQSSQSSLYKKLVWTLSVLVVFALSGVFYLGSQYEGLVKETKNAQIASVEENKLPAMAETSQSLKSPRKMRMLNRDALPGASSGFPRLLGDDGVDLAKVVSYENNRQHLLAKTEAGYFFQIDSSGYLTSYSEDIYFQSSDCFGEMWVDSHVGMIFKDRSELLWYVPKHESPRSIDIYSKRVAAGQCENLSRESKNLVPLLLNDSEVTSLSVTQLHIEDRGF